MKKIKIGQIGVCHEHAAAKMSSLRKISDVFEVVGVVNDTGTMAARYAGFDIKPEEQKVYDGLRWMTEEELFSTSDLDAVLVETPNQNLVPTATRCMQNGLAIHMDKPGGEDLVLFQKLLEDCQKKRLPFQMGYMFRNNPAMLFCRKAIAEGWIGNVFEVQASMNHNYGGETYQEYIGKLSGGIMFNLGCHLIDFILSFMGRPHGVTSFLKSAPDDAEHIKNNCLAILEYPHATVTLRVCSREVDGHSKRRIKICGTKGTLELSPLEVFDGQALKMQMTLLETADKYSPGNHVLDFGIHTDRYMGQLLEFAKIIRRETNNTYSYEHDLLVQEVVLASSGYFK